MTTTSLPAQDPLLSLLAPSAETPVSHPGALMGALPRLDLAFETLVTQALVGAEPPAQPLLTSPAPVPTPIPGEDKPSSTQTHSRKPHPAAPAALVDPEESPERRPGEPIQSETCPADPAAPPVFRRRTDATAMLRAAPRPDLLRAQGPDAEGPTASPTESGPPADPSLKQVLLRLQGMETEPLIRPEVSNPPTEAASTASTEAPHPTTTPARVDGSGNPLTSSLQPLNVFAAPVAPPVTPSTTPNPTSQATPSAARTRLAVEPTSDAPILGASSSAAATGPLTTREQPGDAVPQRRSVPRGRERNVQQSEMEPRPASMPAPPSTARSDGQGASALDPGVDGPAGNGIGSGDAEVPTPAPEAGLKAATIPRPHGGTDGIQADIRQPASVERPLASSPTPPVTSTPEEMLFRSAEATASAPRIDGAKSPQFVEVHSAQETIRRPGLAIPVASEELDSSFPRFAGVSGRQAPQPSVVAAPEAVIMESADPAGPATPAEPRALHAIRADTSAPDASAPDASAPDASTPASAQSSESKTPARVPRSTPEVRPVVSPVDIASEEPLSSERSSSPLSAPVRESTHASDPIALKLESSQTRPAPRVFAEPGISSVEMGVSTPSQSSVESPQDSGRPAAVAADPEPPMRHHDEPIPGLPTTRGRPIPRSAPIPTVDLKSPSASALAGGANGSAEVLEGAGAMRGAVIEPASTFTRSHGETAHTRPIGTRLEASGAELSVGEKVPTEKAGTVVAPDLGKTLASPHAPDGKPATQTQALSNSDEGQPARQASDRESVERPWNPTSAEEKNTSPHSRRETSREGDVGFRQIQGNRPETTTTPPLGNSSDSPATQPNPILRATAARDMSVPAASATAASQLETTSDTGAGLAESAPMRSRRAEPVVTSGHPTRTAGDPPRPLQNVRESASRDSSPASSTAFAAKAAPPSGQESTLPSAASTHSARHSAGGHADASTPIRAVDMKDTQTEPSRPVPMTDARTGRPETHTAEVRRGDPSGPIPTVPRQERSYAASASARIEATGEPAVPPAPTSPTAPRPLDPGLRFLSHRMTVEGGRSTFSREPVETVVKETTRQGPEPSETLVRTGRTLSTSESGLGQEPLNRILPTRTATLPEPALVRSSIHTSETARSPSEAPDKPLPAATGAPLPTASDRPNVVLQPNADGRQGRGESDRTFVPSPAATPEPVRVMAPVEPATDTSVETTPGKAIQAEHKALGATGLRQAHDPRLMETQATPVGEVPRALPASPESERRVRAEVRSTRTEGLDPLTRGEVRVSRFSETEAFLAELGTVGAESVLGMRRGRKADKPSRAEAPNLPGARQDSPLGSPSHAAPASSANVRGSSVTGGGTGQVSVAHARRDDALSEPALAALAESHFERPRETSETAVAAPSSTAERVHRLESLIHREVLLVRRFAAESMSVVLRPDAHTELAVNLRQMDGYVEAAVRCERGDVNDLRGHWRELQESLAAHNVRLLPLPEPTTVVVTPDAPSSHGSRMSFTDERPSRQSEPPPNGSDNPRSRSGTPSAPSSGGAEPSSARRADRRGGWEFWA